MPLPTGQLFARAAKPAANLLVDRFMHIEARRRHAHLARIAELGSRREIEHRVDIHIVEHQHGRMAAEFHRRALHAGCGLRRELLAHRDGARERARRG